MKKNINKNQTKAPFIVRILRSAVSDQVERRIVCMATNQEEACEIAQDYYKQHYLGDFKVVAVFEMSDSVVMEVCE